MPPSAVTAEAVAAAAVAADAAAAARDATAAAHDELDTVAEEPAAVTTAAEPATEPPVAAPASETDLAAPPEPPATTAPTPFAALATPPPPPPVDDDAAPAIPRWAFLRVGRAMERSAVADADDEVSYLDVDLDPGAAPRARGFFAAAAPPPLADPAPPAPDGTPPGQGQGQGQLVVPGLPRGASAGSLAYSQTTTEGSYVDVHVSSPSSSSHGVSPRSQSSGRSEDI